MYVTVRGDKRPATFRRTRSEMQSVQADDCALPASAVLD